MNELLTLQRQFMAQVVSPEPPTSQRSGMQAYRDAYLLRIDEALRTDFDAVHQILGDDEMLALSADYIESHPSKQPSIRWVGHELAPFIASSARWSRVPLLAAMARFEWNKSSVFDGKDAPAQGLEDLQTIAPELWGNMRFEFIPALTLEAYPANVPPIWQQLSRRENVPSPTAEKQVPWLMWRKELIVHWRSLDDAEHAALLCLRAGATFAELCQNLIAFVDSEEQVPSLAMRLLLQWCEDKIICEFQP